MPRLLYKGKMSPLLKMGLISNNVIAWINGNSRDVSAMRQRIMEGYEGEYCDDVKRYDELTADHYKELAEKLLSSVDIQAKKILDVGCGTGILSEILLEQRARKVVCVDFSKQMTEMCKEKFEQLGYSQDRFEHRIVDAENLPFEDNTFDCIVSGMMLGLVVDQEKILSEIYRVLKPGGDIAISTHGPKWYYEVMNTMASCLLKNYPAKNIGSSGGAEFWPLTKKMFRNMLKKEGFERTEIKNHCGRIDFNSGGDVYDFFAACSSAWFLGAWPEEERESVSRVVRKYFSDKKVKNLTFESLMGYGTKN